MSQCYQASSMSDKLKTRLHQQFIDIALYIREIAGVVVEQQDSTGCKLRCIAFSIAAHTLVVVSAIYEQQVTCVPPRCLVLFRRENHQICQFLPCQASPEHLAWNPTIRESTMCWLMHGHYACICPIQPMHGQSHSHRSPTTVAANLNKRWWVAHIVARDNAEHQRNQQFSLIFPKPAGNRLTLLHNLSGQWQWICFCCK